MHSRQIQYFLAVVEHGGFGRAAAALQVAQPTLSQSVRALERDLGADLFHRAGSGVVLSAAGQALLGPARQLMRDVDAARRSLGGAPEPTALDLVAAPPLGAYPGAAIVAALRAGRPDVLVRVERAEGEALIAMLRDGLSEVALAYLPIARLGLVETELGAHELVLALPPHLEAAPQFAADRVAIGQLANLRLLGTGRGTWQREVVEAALRAAGVATRLVVELGQRDTVLDLVRAGVGAAFIVDAAAPRAAARGLRVCRVDPPLRRGFGLVHPPGPRSEAALAFIAQAQAWAAEPGAET